MSRSVSFNKRFQSFWILTLKFFFDILHINFTTSYTKLKKIKIKKNINLSLIFTLINDRSFVPKPAMLLCKRWAKNAGRLDVTQTMAKSASLMSPLNSFLMSFSKVFPVNFMYSSQTNFNCSWLLEHKTRINSDSSVPHLSMPAFFNACASAFAVSTFVFGDSSLPIIFL